MKSNDSIDLKKRQTISTLAKVSATTCIAGTAPYVFAKTKTTLRVMGTHVTLQEEIRKQAMKDLGINIEFEAKGSAAVLQKASVPPHSFDLFE
ncbi:MAG: putative spermidine/putrescine transport system substrate-binding protein [Psychrobacter glaciei]|jgi:putative spermidine/putrescine transport system substrate-binding protein